MTDDIDAIEDFIRRGTAAQRAVDKLTTPKRTDSYDKIRLKGSPTQYKTGKAGPRGAARLHRQVQALVIAASRLERKGGVDARYAESLRMALQAFLAVHRPEGI